MWPIVSTALAEGRHELVLTGSEITKLLQESGFDDRIYKLNKLNFLEISHTCLETLSEKISDLTNLTQLGLNNNQLKELPASLVKIKSLRFLDFSFNKISHLEGDLFCHLANLTTLNLCGNELESIPSVTGLESLHELRASKNKIKDIPEGIEKLTNLIVLDLSQNQLTSLPEQLCTLNNLKHADFSNNSLNTVPASLHQCRKLHVLRLQDNPLKDNRLRKLANDEHNQTALFDYLRRMDDSSGKNKKTKGKHGAKKLATSSTDNDKESVPSPDEAIPDEIPTQKVAHIVIQRPDEEENYYINQTQSIKQGPRPYLIACTIHGVRFSSESHLRSFIRMQDDWHHDIGQMRRRATLATHDLSCIKFPLTYNLREAQSFEVHVLNRTKPCMGHEFLNQLAQEADADRRTRRQAKFSQLYRYLNCLDIDPARVKVGCSTCMLPVVTDATHTVISVPPLTNCNQTRLTTNTRDMMIEVSGTNLNICREFAEVVIAWLMEHALPNQDSSIEPNPQSSSTNDATTTAATDAALANQTANQLSFKKIHVPDHSLVVRPIRVLDFEAGSNLCAMFPSKPDLCDPKFNTVR